MCGHRRDEQVRNRVTVRVLAVSDEVSEGLRADIGPALGAELILACGDLPFEYLGYLMDALQAPLVFVPGNHDPDLTGYRLARNGLTLRAGLPSTAPWPPGAILADGRVVDIAGLRVAGLGGSLRYRPGPNQYSEHQLARRGWALSARARWARRRDGRGVDVLLTHAPPAGVGDGSDPAHRGFRALHPVLARLRPGLLLHGHVHPYGSALPPQRVRDTEVRNVVGWHLLELPSAPSGRGVYTSRSGPFHRLPES
jgi:calcineurin-like phosphoesterase family protein